MTTKQQFLSEHNKLSPENLQATEEMLARFRIEKAAVFKDNDWSIEKLRRPFIMWLTSLSPREKSTLASFDSNIADGRTSETGRNEIKSSPKFSSYPKKRGTSVKLKRANSEKPAVPAKRRF